MRISNQEVWEKWVTNNDDLYGKAILEYAQRWAEFMEPHIDAGEDIASFAKKTSNTADTEGITGFMYGAAVSVLTSCWEYGEALRLWYNLDIQIGTEGEEANKKPNAVLNPAMLLLG